MLQGMWLVIDLSLRIYKAAMQYGRHALESAHSQLLHYLCVMCQALFVLSSILPCWADAGLERGYWNTVQIGPLNPSFGCRLLCSNDFWLETAIFRQLIALSHYARLFQAWRPVWMYAFVNSPQLIIADGEYKDGGDKAEALRSARR